MYDFTSFNEEDRRRAGERLMLIRKSKGLTQKQLGEEVGIQQGIVSRAERGQKLHLYNAKKFNDYLAENTEKQEQVKAEAQDEAILKKALKNGFKFLVVDRKGDYVVSKLRPKREGNRWKFEGAYHRLFVPLKVEVGADEVKEVDSYFVKEVDWLTIPEDTKIEIKNGIDWQRAHFAYYDSTDNRVFFFVNGLSRYTAGISEGLGIYMDKVASVHANRARLHEE